MKSVHAVINKAETKPLTTERLVFEGTLERFGGNLDGDRWLDTKSCFFPVIV